MCSVQAYLTMLILWLLNKCHTFYNLIITNYCKPEKQMKTNAHHIICVNKGWNMIVIITWERKSHVFNILIEPTCRCAISSSDNNTTIQELGNTERTSLGDVTVSGSARRLLYCRTVLCCAHQCNAAYVKCSRL